MLHRITAVVLVAVLVHGNLAAQTQTQSPVQTVSQMQKVLREAQEKGKAVRVTLNRKMDNQRKFSGQVSDISDRGFTLADAKTGKTMGLAYEDVKEVRRKGMSRGEKIATGVAIAGAFVLVMTVLYFLGVTKSND
jgi:hypothetical protein